jgi:hypothetical protein
VTYKINGTELDPQPTDGKWVEPQILDEDGDGRALYPAVYEFEMMWQLAAPTLFASLLQTWRGVSVSGTVVVELPQYNSSTYQFYAYSGVLIDQPTIDPYFQGHNKGIKVKVKNVRPHSVPAS